MKRVIFDCDNTMGVKDCDVDDGLALIYLLGSNRASIELFSCSYGNSELDVVYEASSRLLSKLSCGSSLLKGGSRAGDYENEASYYMAKMAREHPGEFSVLATGAMTNIAGAYLYDKRFFENIKEVIVMGGITEKLVFKKKVMDELNLSCDPHASFLLLKHAKNLSIMSANNCLKVLFQREEYKKKFGSSDKNIAKYIYEETKDYFLYNNDVYGIEGFYNWDVSAAAYLCYPEFFRDDIKNVALSESDLKKGYLRLNDEAEFSINLPYVLDVERFKQNIYSSCLNIDI